MKGRTLACALGVLGLLAMPGLGHTDELTDLEAIAWLRRIDALERESAQGHANGEMLLRLANAYARVGDAAHCRETAAQAVRAGVEAVRAKLLLGDLEWRWGRYGEAAHHYIDALVSVPDQPYALTQLWRIVYAVTSQGTGADFDLRDVIARLGQAGLYFPEQRATGAPTDLPQASRRELDRLIRDANALLSRGLSDSAIAMLERAAGINPGASEIYRSLGRAYEQQHDMRRASGAMLLYLSLRPDAPEAAEIRRWLLDAWRNAER